MRILLVEDNHRLNASLRQSLIEDGYAVDPAYDGGEGEELACMTAYDVIMLDIMLPDQGRAGSVPRPAQQAHQHPHPDADGAGYGRRPHPGPGQRRRRLPDQAVRHGRAAGPPARPAAA